MADNQNREQIDATFKLQEATKSLQKALVGGNAAAKAQVRALEASTRASSHSWRANVGLWGAIEDAHKSIGDFGSNMVRSLQGIINPLDLLRSALLTGVSQSDQYQEAALRLGTDVNKIIGSFPGEMSHVTGGFVAAMDSTFKQMDMGMTDLGTHTSMAAVRTAALNGDVNSLIKTQRTMQTHLGMNNHSINNSSKRMIELSQQYGISSDRLVASLDALAASQDMMAALGIGEAVNNSVMELTAKMGAGNEKLIAKFTNSLLATGSASVQHAVLGGIQDLQNSMLQGNISTGDLEKGMLEQGRRLQSIVSNMQADGVQMNVAMDQLASLYGPGAQAALQLARSYDNLTPEQISKQERLAKIQEDWGNTLSTLKEEILTPIKVAISKNLPAIINFLKQFSGFFKSMLKGILITASAIAAKRGAGGLLGGLAGGDPLRALLGAGTMAAGIGGVGLGVGVEGAGGAQGALGLVTGLLPLAATLLSKNKGVLGSIGKFFDKSEKQKQITGLGKLGTRSNPMHVIMSAGGGEGVGISDALDLLPDKFKKKIPGLKSIEKVMGKSRIGKKALDLGSKVSNIFGKSGTINRGLGKAVQGIAKQTGPILGKGVGGMLKKFGGRQAAKAFGGFLGKRLAATAAVQVVPVAGQVIGAAMAIWTVAEVGLMYWKYKKEKEKAVRDQKIQEDLHERQQRKIQDELSAFNEGMQKSTSFMKITNEELRTAMRKTVLGGTEGGALTRLANATEETIKLQQKLLAEAEITSSNTTPPMMGAED
jgi:hypothetical protein